MKKIALIVLLLVVAVGAVAFYLLSPASATTAVLYIERGQVEISTNGQWSAATDEMRLKEGSSVRTKDGEATIALLEGEMLHLEPNSEVSLEAVGNSMQIRQVAGETFSKITRLSGMKEYSISTPTTVATVRGTVFSLTDDEVLVSDGEVEYASGGNKVAVHAGKMASKSSMTENDAPAEKLEKLKGFRNDYVQVLKRMRLRELKRINAFTIAAKMGYDEDAVMKALEDIDEGKMDEDELFGEVPSLFKPKLKRAYMLTKEIKQAKR